MSTPIQRVLAELQVRAQHPNPRPADGTGHPNWAQELDEERAYHRQLQADHVPPTWTDLLRLHAARALTSTEAATLRRELLDLGGVIAGWVEDLDTRRSQQGAES